MRDCSKDRKKEIIMCFRPSAVSMNDSSIQTGECPNCGMPVAAPAGVTSGDCPHCGNPIPAAPNGQEGAPNPGNNVRIL